MIRSAALAVLFAFTLFSSDSMAQSPTAASPAGSEAGPDLWLEEVEGERALAWVEAQNARSLGTLQGDPRYDALYAQALAIAQARDRIAQPVFSRTSAGEVIDNFWQGADHMRGVWRTTSLDSYASDAPQWETVLDIDALAAAEGLNWVYKGATCLPPTERLCLVQLSDGGKDAVTIREFDRDARVFVEDGFVLQESKGGATWIDENTLLIDRDFGPGTLTASGYPMLVKRLGRGQPIDQAVEIFRGEPTDVAVGARVLHDADGVAQVTLIRRQISYYQVEQHILGPDGELTRLQLPARSNLTALVEGQLVITTNEDWTAPSGQTFEAGDLFSYDLETWRANAAAPATLILRPGAREAVEGVATTRNTLVVALYENVRGGVYVYRHGVGGWTRRRMDLPQNISVDLVSASERDDRLFISVTGYLNPSSLWLADAATGEARQVKSLPPKFDAEGMRVEQFEARSADGTMIPYFVVRKDGYAADGSNPTLLYGYGGFQVSMLPGYLPTMGKLWLERGGVYAVANTRGGGEFGPNWHQAALQGNRQRAHEDFEAVAADLIARGITSQRRLGVMGGSQGGLLVAALLTQRPDLINAAVIQVPLFDMLRYHRLLAGASWIGEYGDPDIPEHRAWLEAYSPYQNLRAGQPYPEVFIHTSTKDDRVHPAHARRGAARLEALGYPVLFYENTDGGHASGANLRETARRLALEYTYLTRQLMD